MRKFSNKMVLSVLTLVLLVVALGTTTYAWFTVGNTTSVEQFETEVTSGHGLEMVYLDSGNTERGGWKRTITASDIIAYLEADYGLSAGQWATHFRLKPVTSTNGTEFKKLTTTTTEYDTLSAATRADGYVEFKLKFRTMAPGASLVWKNVTLNSTGVQWAPEVSFTGVGGETVNTTPLKSYYAKNAARISVNAGATTFVYELPSTEAPDYSNTQLSNNAPNWTQGAHHYFQKVTGVDLSSSHGSYTAVTTITDLTGAGKTLGTLTGELDQYQYLTVTVRIYLEGFDSETFNAILKDKLQVALGFSMV